MQQYFYLGQPLLRRPKHSGSLLATFHRGRIDGNIAGYFRGQTLDMEPNFGASAGPFPNPGYTNFGVNLNYRVRGNFTAYANLRNALNQRYEEIYGFPVAAAERRRGPEVESRARRDRKQCKRHERTFRTTPLSPSTASIPGAAMTGAPLSPEGSAVPKDDLRIEAYGTVDELNSFIGLARESARDLPELDADSAPRAARTFQPRLHPRHPAGRRASQPGAHHRRRSEQLEREIDRMNEALPPLRSFVLPGGCRLNAELHVCRTVCRRAERICVSLAGAAGRRCRYSEIPEPAQRRFLRLEPLGQRSAGRARNAVGAQRGCFANTRRR